MTRRLLALVSAIALSGCISSSTVIRVKTDGSGTIDQTLLVGVQNMEKAFAGMGLKPSGDAKSTRKSTPVSEEDLKKNLGRIGDGVSLVSLTPVKQPDGFEGVSVRFAFDDIAKLNTEDFLMPGPAAGEMKSDGGRDGIRFAIARREDGVSVLTATFQETRGGSSAPKNKAKESPGPGLDDPDLREMVQMMFKGFRIGVDLEVAGQILNTNADYVDGKRITLVSMDIEQMLRDTSKLEAIDKVLTPDASIAKVRPYLKDVKGLKINHPTVTVEFR